MKLVILKAKEKADPITLKQKRLVGTPKPLAFELLQEHPKGFIAPLEAFALVLRPCKQLLQCFLQRPSAFVKTHSSRLGTRTMLSPSSYTPAPIYLAARRLIAALLPTAARRGGPATRGHLAFSQR